MITHAETVMTQAEGNRTDGSGGDTPEERARQRLASEKGFYAHLATYVIVIGALFLINVATGARWWFFWPAIGWGIGILVHAVSVFGVGSFAGRDWEERRLRELIDQERERH
jgi:hypothetical protein